MLIAPQPSFIASNGPSNTASRYTLVADGTLSNCDTLSAQTAARRRTVLVSHSCSNVLGTEYVASLAQLYSVRWLGGLASHHQHCKHYHHTTENSPRDAFTRTRVVHTLHTAPRQEPPCCMTCCENLPAHVSSRASARSLCESPWQRTNREPSRLLEQSAKSVAALSLSPAAGADAYCLGPIFSDWCLMVASTCRPVSVLRNCAGGPVIHASHAVTTSTFPPSTIC